jgi:hypothetical protein
MSRLDLACIYQAFQYGESIGRVLPPMNTLLRHNVARAPRLAIEVMYRHISIHITMPTLFINVQTRAQ